MLTSGRPNFVSSRSNINEKQIEGTITGAILRCLDCSSYNEKCTLAVQNTLTELCLLNFAPKIFVWCFSKLRKRYEIMNEFLREFRFLCSTRHSWVSSFIKNRDEVINNIFILEHNFPFWNISFILEHLFHPGTFVVRCSISDWIIQQIHFY